MSQSLTETEQPTLSELACCIDCGTPLLGHDRCPGCERVYATRDDIIEAIGPLGGRNRIVAAFYDGPGWNRFRKWERLFLVLQGGARRARMSILRHLSGLNHSAARVLEVGIGDGENLRFLPPSWAVYGVDIARTQLVACRDRFPRTRGRLAWAEAERLPFPDATFDACYSIGGFTYYEDHAAALRSAPGHACRRTRGRRRRDSGHASGGHRPPDRPAGHRQVLAPSARARRGFCRHGVALRCRSPRSRRSSLARAARGRSGAAWAIA